MKHFYSLAVFLAACTFAFGQEVVYPPGYDLGYDHLASLPLIDVGTVNSALVSEEDNRVEQETGRWNNGRIIPVQLNAENSGTWTTLADGSRIWQLRIRTFGALGVMVYMNDVFIPVGANLFLYSADMTFHEGPYNHFFNNEFKLMVLGEVFGDEAVLEYHEPAGVVETPRLGINGIGHMYRGVHDYRDLRGGSQFCEVDVNCPEGAEWVYERDAAVRLQLVDNGQLFLCSGSLVNNTSMDCRNFILSAMHCTAGISTADLSNTQVRFKYQRSGCGSGGAPGNLNLTGCVKRGDSADGGGDSGSDYVLLELQTDIPSSWDPFYAGWDATGLTPPDGVSIHHPNGDVKKISTTTDIVSGTWPGGATAHHWRVEWMETVTNWGVTEGGSSGSPLYNNNHHIVGTLTGGLSFCDAPTDDDYYGKFSKHWNGNPNPTSSHLETWLNPESSTAGQLTMFGSYRNDDLSEPCSVGLQENLAFDDVDVYPTLASDIIYLSSDLYHELKEVRIFDNEGRMVDTVRMTGPMVQWNVRAYPTGVYYISFIRNNGNYLTKKMVKN